MPRRHRRHRPQADVTSDQINTLITATGNEVEAYWPTLFSAFLAKTGIEKLILAASSGGQDKLLDPGLGKDCLLYTSPSPRD